MPSEDEYNTLNPIDKLYYVDHCSPILRQAPPTPDREVILALTRGPDAFVDRRAGSLVAEREEESADSNCHNTN